MKDNESESETKLQEKPKIKPKPPAKRRFAIRLSALVPIDITYQIEALDEKEALVIFEKQYSRLHPTIMSKPRLNGLKKLMISIYLYGQSVIKLTKRY